MQEVKMTQCGNPADPQRVRAGWLIAGLRSAHAEVSAWPRWKREAYRVVERDEDIGQTFQPSPHPKRSWALDGWERSREGRAEDPR